ncbi:MAG: sulfatase/phosphatase domain-containing protein, partial [Planctomycetota bacterium]
ELIDLYPTICEVMDIPVPTHCQGYSLKPILEETETRVREAALTVHQKGKKTQFLLRTSQYAYMEYPDGSAELYDMSVDPLQTKNLAAAPSETARIRELSAALSELRKTHDL